MPIGPEYKTAEIPAQPADTLIGAKVGDYVIVRRLGSGGMGVVYEAVQPQIDKHVAIKVLQRASIDERNEAESLQAEARTLSAIHHRGIVDIFNFGQISDGRQYMVMELLIGEPLDQVIARSAPIPAEQTIAIIDEVLDAVGAAHRAGVIHRDLKPSNIFLVQPPHGPRYVKVLDFGLAKRQSTVEEPGLVGTPLYMPPEQTLGQGVGPASDVYAIGCAAFEMLTKRPPFDAQSEMEIVALHVRADRPRAHLVEPSVPLELSELIAGMMDRDARLRPAPDIVRAELKRIQELLHDQTTAVASLDGVPGSRTEPLIFASPTPPAAAAPARSHPTPRSWESPHPATLPEVRVHSPESEDVALLAQTRPRRTSTPRYLAGGLVALALAAIVTWRWISASADSAPNPNSAEELSNDPRGKIATPAAVVRLPPAAAPISAAPEPPSRTVEKRNPSTHSPIRRRLSEPEAPSLAALTRRVVRLRADLEAREELGFNIDQSAKPSLDDIEKRLKPDLDTTSRQQLASDLDTWERRYGRKH
jgi:serine/threonine protein kinase